LSFKGILTGLITLIVFLPLYAQTFDLKVQNRSSLFVQETGNTSVQSNSIWWAQDKGRHLAGSMISTIFIGKLSQQVCASSTRESQMWGAGITFSLGLVKETFDSQSKGNRFSVEDLVADIAGITIGILLLGVH
jgi:uncharacterized protein YfiM (DUF2279 family)